jgi:hypothetical protein
MCNFPAPEEGPNDVKRPAFQWYPGDFRRDTALQACSFEARALWREMLDLMHDGEPYGHLTAGGVAMNETHVARIAGVSVVKARKWMAELEAHKVFSRTGTGVIYSRRMVKDEHIRTVRAAAGKKGGNPELLDNQTAEDLLNQSDKQNPTPASASSSAVAFAQETDADDSATAVEIAGYCNAGIAEKWGEQTRPLTFGQCASLAEALRLAGVPRNAARDGIVWQCRTSRKSEPPKHPNYFHDGIIQHHERALAQQSAAGVTLPPSVRITPPFQHRPTKQDVGRANLQAAIERRAHDRASNGK